MSKPKVLLIVTLVSLGAIIGLLGWAMARSGGIPGGLLVFSNPGEVSLEPQPAIDFTLKTIEGDSIRFSDLQGKVVMVDFWSSWCPPCRVEAPALEQAYEQFRGQGVEFIGVAIWDREKEVRSFLSRYGIKYMNGLDERGHIAIDYGVRGIPEKYFIDRQGYLVRKFIGPISMEKLTEVLDELLSEGGRNRE